VLRVGQIRIMFDCGSNEFIDQKLLDIVKREADKANYILLSHSTCMHVGALAYLHAQGNTIKVIATSPVAKIGAQTMHELYIQKKESPQINEQSSGIDLPNSSSYKEFMAFTLEDVEESFE
jgi:Cft2 family RNA processing exonuclease